MPHTGRKQGESGFYHVVAKGNGGQIVFEGDANRRRYLEILKDALEEHRVKLHAYCLMSNHIHFLLEGESEELSAFMKQLSERYAMYYVRETGRSGHVFRRPFWSEPIESDEYFLSTLRYIHLNPQAAGLCLAHRYPWSSYKSYLENSSFVETAFALGILGGMRQFASFHVSDEPRATPFPGSHLRNHLNNDELVRIATRLIGRDTLIALKQVPPETRRPHIRKLANAGFTEREIARISGLGRYAIHRDLS